MFIDKVELKNFKRFTDLTLDLSGLPTPPRLVLLIGVNGSGKSCVFDAFELLTNGERARGDESYYAKGEQPFSISVSLTDKQASAVQLALPGAQVRRAMFYGRSAFRYVPELTAKTVGGTVNLEKDSDRPRRYIEFDQRFENDIGMTMRKMFAEFFGDESAANTLKDRYLLPINQALARIFGKAPAIGLKFHSLLPPLEGDPVDLFFSKGQTAQIHYNLLSSGEKEMINLLLNLLMRREYYRDTIYFIDELDVHLNTALQYALLKEIVENWLPPGCQLWTASHSLGFIQYARESADAVILDFDQFDFDLPQTITPQPKESLEVYEIAVPKETMLRVFHGKQLILCENKNDEYYNLLGLENKLFVGVQDKRQVYLNVKHNPAYSGLMDRDYLTEVEMDKIRQRFPTLQVLAYYAFENYLYHPDNLAEAVVDFDVPAYRAEIVRQKNEQRDYVLTGLELARRSYAVLNDENIPRDEKGIETIVTALRSDDFETFYPYFDMKTRFNRRILSRLRPAPKRLVQTNWFRARIAQLFP